MYVIWVVAASGLRRVAKVDNGFMTISGLQDFNGALIVLCGEIKRWDEGDKRDESLPLHRWRILFPYLVYPSRRSLMGAVRCRDPSEWSQTLNAKSRRTQSSAKLCGTLSALRPFILIMCIHIISMTSPWGQVIKRTRIQGWFYSD